MKNTFAAFNLPCIPVLLLPRPRWLGTRKYLSVAE